MHQISCEMYVPLMPVAQVKDHTSRFENGHAQSIETCTCG